MSSNVPSTPPLNDVQLMLLRLFSRPMSVEEMANIRKLLLDYYEQQLQKELDTVILQKGIKRSDFEELLQKDQRSR